MTQTPATPPPGARRGRPVRAPRRPEDSLLRTGLTGVLAVAIAALALVAAAALIAVAVSFLY